MAVQVKENEFRGLYEKYLTCLIMVINGDIISVRYDWVENTKMLRSVSVRRKQSDQYDVINVLSYDCSHAAIRVLQQI